MRTFLPVVIVVAAVFTSTRAAAQQAPGVAAALVHAGGEVYLNDQAIESNSVSAVLPDSAVLRTSRGPAAVALKRGGGALPGLRHSGPCLRERGVQLQSNRGAHGLSACRVGDECADSGMRKRDQALGHRGVPVRRAGAILRRTVVPAPGLRRRRGRAARDRHQCSARRPGDDVQSSMRGHDSHDGVFARATRRLRSVGEADA